MGRRVFIEKARTAVAGKLSPREFQIFVGLAEGRSAKDIAAELKLMESYIYVASSSIYKKLRAKGSAEVRAWADDRDIIEEGTHNRLGEIQEMPNKANGHNHSSIQVEKKAELPVKREEKLAGLGRDLMAAAPKSDEEESEADLELDEGRGVAGERVEDPAPTPEAKSPRDEPRVSRSPHTPTEPLKGSAIVREDQIKTMQELHGTPVESVTWIIGDMRHKLARTAAKSLRFEVASMGDRDDCWIVERDYGRITAMHNCRCIASIQFGKEER